MKIGTHRQKLGNQPRARKELDTAWLKYRDRSTVRPNGSEPHDQLLNCGFFSIGYRQSGWRIHLGPTLFSDGGKLYGCQPATSGARSKSDTYSYLWDDL